MSLIQKLQMEPNPLIPGKNVTITLEVTDPASIADAKVYDPRGYELRLKPTDQDGKTVYTLTEFVPDDASGIHYATLVLRDTAGNVERKHVEINVR